MKLIIYLVSFVTIYFPSIIFAQKVDEFFVKAVKNYLKITDYSCLFHKKELVANTYYEDSNVEVKFKKPHSYYMKWTQGDDEGQEVVYSEGRYNNEIQAHLGGFFNFLHFSLNPEGIIAMRKTNHPVYHLDIGYILNILRSNYELHNRLKLGKIIFEMEEMQERADTFIVKAEFPEGKGFYAKKNLYKYRQRNISSSKN